MTGLPSAQAVSDVRIRAAQTPAAAGLTGFGNQSVQVICVAGFDGGLELVQCLAHQGALVQHFVTVGQQDVPPDIRIAGRDAADEPRR